MPNFFFRVDQLVGFVAKD